jgi:NAD(P)-dependent dehydrogenase (short-subunit alcohol dehydrogenase family)
MLVLALEEKYVLIYFDFFLVLKFVLFKCFSTSDEVFKKIMEVNYFGLVRLTNEIVKYMIEDTKKCKNSSNKHTPQQSIVMVGSVQSLLSVPYRSACNNR